MGKYLFFFRKSFIIAGLLSILLIILDLLFKISLKNTNGIYIAFTSLMIILFATSLYLFFIFSDIKKNQFFFLRFLNYVSLFASFVFFVIWGIIFPDALAFLFPAYFAFMTTINLLVMSIIYLIKKTGGKYFFKDWFYLFGLIAFYVLCVIIMKCIKS